MEECRKRGVYVQNVPANVGNQKLEGIFENEADSNVEDVYLVKVCSAKVCSVKVCSASEHRDNNVIKRGREGGGIF